MLSTLKMTRADRLVDGCWRTLTWTMIAAVGLFALISLYSAMMLCFAQKWDQIASPLSCGIALGFADFLLCRYRNDVVGG